MTKLRHRKLLECSVAQWKHGKRRAFFASSILLCNFIRVCLVERKRNGLSWTNQNYTCQCPTTAVSVPIKKAQSLIVGLFLNNYWCYPDDIEVLHNYSSVHLYLIFTTAVWYIHFSFEERSCFFLRFLESCYLIMTSISHMFMVSHFKMIL